MTGTFQNIQAGKLDKELVYIASRSSGPGGQHVNKVSTRIELRFDVLQSALLNDEEKLLLFRKLKNKINKEGVLILASQSYRSQIKNKENVRDKFYQLLDKALSKPKVRKASKPSASAIEKRLAEKHMQAEKKKGRQLPDED
ncbi:MAG: aminoacyl-tRNA hydrolase [Bacteroidetes bacterium]|nr:aminoacyl-tRNA hydrolase [Bacteroidota bacterium]